MGLIGIHITCGKEEGHDGVGNVISERDDRGVITRKSYDDPPHSNRCQIVEQRQPTDTTKEKVKSVTPQHRSLYRWHQNSAAEFLKTFDQQCASLVPSSPRSQQN
jgi:hypothetical protein